MRATLRLMTARGQIRSSEIAPELTGDTVSHLASVRHTTVSMTNSTDRVEIITSVQRRRRWTAPEKVRMVEETFEPGMTVSLVTRSSQVPLRGDPGNVRLAVHRVVGRGQTSAASCHSELLS